MFAFKKIFILFAIAILLFPSMAFAAKERGLVPCDGACPAGAVDCVPCTFCHVLVLIQNLVNFATYKIFFPLAGLLIFYGGIMMMLGEKHYGKGKEIIKNVIWGLVIVLTSFVLVNTIILILASEANGEFDPADWYKIECRI